MGVFLSSAGSPTGVHSRGLGVCGMGGTSGPRNLRGAVPVDGVDREDECREGEEGHPLQGHRRPAMALEEHDGEGGADRGAREQENM